MDVEATLAEVGVTQQTIETEVVDKYTEIKENAQAIVERFQQLVADLKAGIQKLVDQDPALAKEFNRWRD